MEVQINEYYTPREGLFVGKMVKCLKVLAVVGTLGLPGNHPGRYRDASSAKHAPGSGVSVAATKTVWVTAYTSAPDETSDHPLITASGGMVGDGIVAANFLPFGTQIEIPVALRQ